MAGNRFAAPMARAIGAAAVCLAQASCYALQAVPGNTPPLLGQRIALDITDAGRATIGSSMGQGILQVEGRVIGSDEASYQLAVSAVHLIGGGDQVWSGEKVTIRKEFVSRMYEKKFSTARSVIASAIGIGVVAYFAGKAIEGAGLGDDPKGPRDTTIVDQLRRPIHRPIHP